MDPALLREREAFKKRAMATPTVEKKAKPDRPLPPPPSDDAKRKMRPPTAPKLDSSSYKTMSGSSQYRFGVLAKIVKFMRTRHQDGDDHPLQIEEILDETNQLDIGQSVKNWLSGEALNNNPKIEVSPCGTKFSFKPVYKIKDGKTLMRLLKQHDLKGLGGILMEDVQESLPHCEKVLKNRAAEILFIIRPIDKKKILFYNDRTANFSVDDEFQKLWRSATVDAMDDAKIDEYLEKQGIRSMQDHGLKKPVPKRKKAANKKRQFKKPRDNEHLADVLEIYEDNTLTLKGVNPT
ncbi:general transcription factor IIE subunit 2 [Drosophila obscura]|uniref:general transcription factor IIE subunit 2 n=1 Tax=Drosophila obscura TaxID=7282 RepID=UPI000BA15B06|nr:general transcription factor IIE subunit 2 [Drosophila obscura]